MAKSIMGYEVGFCIVCGSPYTEEHHVIYGRGLRALSEKYGLKVPLCYVHHRDSKLGIHFDKAFDNSLKAEAQRKFEETYPNENFLKIFGRNYK